MMRITTIIKFGILICIGFMFLAADSCFAGDKKEDKQSIRENTNSSSYGYGRYQLFLGSMRTKYKDSRHEVFYPIPQWGINFGCDYYYFRKYIGLGVQFKLGFYKDRGYPTKNKVEPYERDESVRLSRPLFPVSLSLVLNVTPFIDKIGFIPKKLISVKGWFGFEYLYGQEQRPAGDDSSYIDKIRKRALVFGISPSILLSFWDSKSTNTLAVMNIRDIYLSPYMEWSKELGSKTVNFNRRIFGIHLSFETI